ncbi:hypothetical protein RBB50_004234 [Rhinocladiella similis]
MNNPMLFLNDFNFQGLAMADRARSQPIYTDPQRQLRDEDPEAYFESRLKRPIDDRSIADLHMALFDPKRPEWDALVAVVEDTVAITRQKHGLEAGALIDFGKTFGPEHDVLKETCNALQRHPKLSQLRPQAKEMETLVYRTRLANELVFWGNVQIRRNT